MKSKQRLLILALLLATSYLLLATVKYWLADYYFAQGNYERAVTLSPKEPLFRIEYAKTLPEEPANRELLEIETEFPRNIKVLKSLSLAFSDLKDYKKENQILQNLLIFAPTDPWVTYQLALSFGKLGDTKLLKEYLQKTLELKPDYQKALELWHKFN